MRDVPLENSTEFSNGLINLATANQNKAQKTKKSCC